MVDSPSPLKPPNPFQPKRQGYDADIQERKEDILHQIERDLPAYTWMTPHLASSPIWITELKNRWEVDPMAIESSGIPVIPEPQLTHHEHWVIDRQAHRQEIFDPESIERDDVSQVLSQLPEYADSTQEAICDRILDIYENLEIDELAAEEVVNLLQMSSCAKELGRDGWVERANELTEEYFERIEDSPLVSKRPTSSLEEPLSPEEARTILREREERLRDTSESVFEDVDEETIAEMQGAYIKLIWENIRED